MTLDCNIGLIFGTDTGNTEEIGDKISNSFSEKGLVVEMINVTEASVEAIQSFDFIIMGIPTWDFGGIQEDWEYFEDQLGYGDYFVDAMGWLHDRIKNSGAKIIGAWPTTGYDFEASLAVNEDKTQFCGLAIDDDQQFDLTDERIAKWVNQIIDEAEPLLTN